MGEIAFSGGSRALPRVQASDVIRSQLYRKLSGGARSLLLFDGTDGPLQRQIRAYALREAREALLRHEPQYSAAEVLTRGQRKVCVGAILFAACIIVFWPQLGGLLLTGLVAAGYLANAAFRGWLFWVGADALQPERAKPAERDTWPMYTVLVPLYREANVLPQLAHALRQLDYPDMLAQREKRARPARAT